MSPDANGTAEPERSGWALRPFGRSTWRLSRAGGPICQLGVLRPGEWWVRPAGARAPWAETYGSRGAAVRAAVGWWLGTREMRVRAAGPDPSDQ